MRLWQDLLGIPVGRGDGNTDDQPDTAPNYSAQPRFWPARAGPGALLREVLMACRTEQQVH
jgi:hypothetical protein